MHGLTALRRSLERRLERLDALGAPLALGSLVCSVAIGAVALLALRGRAALYLAAAATCTLLWLLTLLAAPRLLLGAHTPLGWWVNLLGVLAGLLAPLLLASVVLG